MSSDHQFTDIMNLRFTYSKGIIGVLKGFQNGLIREEKEGS